jgi:hypothetical protein
VLLPIDFMDELQDIWKTGAVRPDAFVLLRKDEDGGLSGMEGGALSEEADEIAINAVMAAAATRSLGLPELAAAKDKAVADAASGDFGLTADELRGIAARLEPGRSVVIGLFENVWERRLREAASKRGGWVTRQRLIAPDDLNRAMSGLTKSKKR